MSDRLDSIRERVALARRVWWRRAEVYGKITVTGPRDTIPKIAEKVMDDIEWMVGEITVLRDSLRWAADTHDAGDLSPQGLRELLDDLGIRHKS
ncbi:MAG: hypothetical protein RIS35_1469 [Pseudomonadota bacterium]